MESVIYKGNRVLIDAYFYKFWMDIDEFNKFIVH